jgi:hypothetical protein
MLRQLSNGSGSTLNSPKQTTSYFKWIRIVFRCWKDRAAYDESRYLAALAKRNSPLAAVATGTIL